MTTPVTPFEYIDKAFGLNVDKAFDINPQFMPPQITEFIERGKNKRVYFGGIEKQGAKAFRTMIEKRSKEKKITQSPLVVVHREIGSTNDKYDYYNETMQYRNILQALQASVMPKTFSFTIQIFVRRDQRGLLDILAPIIDDHLTRNSMLKVPHVIKWMENGVEQQEEIKVPLDLSLLDVQNPAWTSVIDGHYLGIEKGQDVNTQVIISSMIEPSIVDFNFVGVESL